MISNWSHVSAAPFLLFPRLLRAAIAFAVGYFGNSVAIAADFPSEGFWMASQPKHIRVEGERRAVVHVQKNKPVDGLPGLVDTEESTPWRVTFILIETALGEPQAEFCQITFKARITDAVIDLEPEYGPEDGGRLDYTKVDDGLHIQESSVWPESLRKKGLPYPLFLKKRWASPAPGCISRQRRSPRSRKPLIGPSTVFSRPSSLVQFPKVTAICPE